MKLRILALSGLLAALSIYLLRSTAVDLITTTHRHRPRLYVTIDPVLVTPPTPSFPTVAAVALGWALGVAYGIYLFEKHNPGETRIRLKEKINP